MAYCFVNIQTVKNDSIVRNMHFFFIVYLDHLFMPGERSYTVATCVQAIILSADLTDDSVLCFGEFIATQ